MQKLQNILFLCQFFTMLRTDCWCTFMTVGNVDGLTHPPPVMDFHQQFLDISYLFSATSDTELLISAIRKLTRRMGTMMTYVVCKMATSVMSAMSYFVNSIMFNITRNVLKRSRRKDTESNV